MGLCNARNCAEPKPDGSTEVGAVLLGLPAAAFRFRVLAVVVQQRAYRSQSAQASTESRVTAVGISEIQNNRIVNWRILLRSSCKTEPN